MGNYCRVVVVVVVFLGGDIIRFVFLKDHSGEEEAFARGPHR